MRRILVINPNSNESVTDGLRSSLAEISSDAEVVCCTLADGPFGIETDGDIATVVPLIERTIRRSPDFDAYVVACYSDPGVAECRRKFSKPVFGMQQSAIETAVALGGKFGVLALSDTSIARHLAYIERLGMTRHLAAELPLDVTVDQAANDKGTFDKAVHAGRRLTTEFAATSLILGCAGMAALREPLEQALAVPVIEPAQAALSRALGA